MRISMNSSTSYPSDIDSLKEALRDYGVRGYKLTKINKSKDKGNIVEFDVIFDKDLTTKVLYSKDDEAVTDVTFYLADAIPVNYYTSNYASNQDMSHWNWLLSKHPDIIPLAKERAGEGFKGPDGPRFAQFIYWLDDYILAQRRVKERTEEDLKQAIIDRYGRSHSGKVKIQDVSIFPDDKPIVAYDVTIDGLPGLLEIKHVPAGEDEELVNGYLTIGDTKIELNVWDTFTEKDINRLYSLYEENKSLRKYFKDEVITKEREVENLLKSLKNK